MERESANSHLANDGQNSFSWVTRMKNYALDSLHPLTPAVAGLLIFFGIAQYMTGALLFLHLLTLQIPIPEILDFFTITSVATWIAPAFGFITDLVVVRGQRRKPLLIISAVVLTILWPIIAGVSKDTVTLALGIVSAFFNSVQNTTLNGLIVENTPENKDGRAQSRAFLIRTIASFIGAVINIILLLFTPLRIVLGISSLFYFFSIFFCVFVSERVFSTIANDRHQIHPNPSESTSSKEQHAKTTRRDSPHPVDDTVSAIQSGDIQDDHDSVGENTAPVTHSVEKKQFISLRMTPVLWGKLMFHLCTNLGFLGSFIFVFIYTAVPDASTPYFSYIASLYDFNPVILSIFNAFGLLGGIFGGWFYVRFLTQLNVRLTFVIGSTCYILGILSNLIVVLDFWSKVIHLPIYIFVPLDQFIVTFFQGIAFTPVIQLASLCSPSGIESEVFEFFSVVAFAGGTLSGFLSGLVAQLFNITFTDFNHLRWLILTVAGFRLLSTLFVLMVPLKPFTNEHTYKLLPDAEK